jgi:hypothetical protein
MTETPEITWTPAFVEKHVYYGGKEDETLEHSNVAEYILERLDQGAWDAEELLHSGGFVTVYAYERVPFTHPCEFLDDLLCNIADDEDLGNPDGEVTDQLSAPAMAELRALEQYVASRIKALYTPYGCIPVLKLIVPFATFLETLDEDTRDCLLSGGDDD